jgi:hypothetical protein
MVYFFTLRQITVSQALIRNDFDVSFEVNNFVQLPPCKVLLGIYSIFRFFGAKEKKRTACH